MGQDEECVAGWTGPAMGSAVACALRSHLVALKQPGCVSVYSCCCFAEECVRDARSRCHLTRVGSGRDRGYAQGRSRRSIGSCDRHIESEVARWPALITAQRCVSQVEAADQPCISRDPRRDSLTRGRASPDSADRIRTTAERCTVQFRRQLYPRNVPVDVSRHLETGTMHHHQTWKSPRCSCRSVAAAAFHVRTLHCTNAS